jgi:hypothetical protein
LIVDYQHNIIINIHDDDVMMINNTTCMEGKPANDQTIALHQGAQPYCMQVCGKYSTLITMFAA